MATDEQDSTPPEVGDDAVSSPTPPPTDSAPAQDDTDDTDNSPADATEQDDDPHPGGVTTSDVEATAGKPDTLSNPTGVEANPDAEVSPTGTANEAGTPQSQLNLAPPMADPSGSNIPAPNLRQPLADGVDPTAGAASTSPESLDPALVDPDKAAIERVEGRTSDASTRAADAPHIDEVPADITDGPKPSDGGPERYPFPQGGDVDVATVSKEAQDGEYLPNLTIEDTVILLEHELVPDRLVGRRAFVVDAPRYLIPVDKADEVQIVVRTRDEANATLTLPLAAVDVVRGGRDVTVRG